ncbi:MAG: outer membrane protein assembly factor BamE, partial [Methylobacter sp.]|nr:outer membrane protein assembly factor BamE [Methylobacter sp.]
LIGVQGDFKPSAVAVIKPSTETTVDVPKRDLEKTMWEKITGFFGINATDETSKTDKPAAKPSTESPTNQLPL